MVELMEQSAPAIRRYTVAEYLAFEDAAEDRHEYRDGEIIAMAAARANHIRIVHNLGRHLGNRLNRSGCSVMGENQRVRVSRTRYVYPDQTVVCGPLNYDPPDDDVVLINPQVIFEVLSESTEGVDRGEKFRRYIAVDSLQEYVLIAQDAPRIESFYRHPEGMWAFAGSIEGLESVWKSRSLAIELPLADVYAAVGLAPAPLPPE
jgi:Uma2 family endonuclease